ncbi:MAG: hypothetical protein SAJ12_08205 [Jaaginema sp. PMC 1079.18]|nr:hypothetical protein [Jaaginema sp. PMC 1080.18]MEC4850980.1 hypothetical protein [Jaaginema sp. PMC 1079.18]MEC4865817.1 hypothetical protein [Jaaginema sp. PMC 1078.18]
MKLNSTVALTFVLLVAMLGAGAVSGVWSYTMGHEALKGVTQPDTSPTKKLTGKEKSEPQELSLLKESEIIKNVQEYIREQEQGGNKAQENQEQSFIESPNDPENSVQEVAAVSEANATALPLQTEDEGVTLKVLKASEEDGSLLLEVDLKNESRQAVRFLYSFLDIKDEKGRSLSATTDGLPGELPATGENFSGEIKIPLALIEESQRLSLSLTDYPDQRLELNVPEIPVVR